MLLLLFDGGSSPPSGGFRSLTLLELGGISAPEDAIFGTLNRTNQNDTLSSSGTTTVLGTLSRTNANDTISAAGQVGNNTLNYTNLNDTLSASGTTTILGTLAKTLGNDTLSASGSVGSNRGFRSLALLEIGGISYSDKPSGTINLTEGADSLAGFGVVPVVVVGIHSKRNKVGRGPYSFGKHFRRSRNAYTSLTPGALNVINNNDTINASGFAAIPTGTLTKTNQNDTLNASGNQGIVGTSAITNANDILAGGGTNILTGTVNATNQNDTLNGYGRVGPQSDETSSLPITGAGRT